MNVSVLVSRCIRDRLFAVSLFNESFYSLDTAMSVGKTKQADGVSVIVRPNYNEEDSKGRFFREWRSFNGSPFEEVRWDF